MPQRLLRNSTNKVSELLQTAITELAGMRRGVLTVEFILMTLIEQNDSVVLKIFDEMKLETDQSRREIVDKILEHTSHLPQMDLNQGSAGAMKVSKEVQILFERADRERSLLGDTYISTASIFLSCFDEKIANVKKILNDVGLDYEKCFEVVTRIRGNKKISQKDGETRATFLEEYTIDLTALARKNQLDPVIGRNEEIRRVIEILSRRKKNNPILIGKPGVGKTVVVEGLAQQIVNADVPEFLLNRKILSLEIGVLIAGAKIQGEFEERLKSIRDEIIASSGEIILFIDEIHTVVGAGRSGGGLDASNMLKPALAKGLLQCLGATTLREYKQFFESDKALERRFQQVKIEEPSIPQAISILKGLKEKYQNHHQIDYSDDAIEKSVTLSAKYIEQRCLPDKAIDLMDEAGAAKRIKVIYVPPEIRKLEGQRLELEREKAQAFQNSDFEKMASFQMELSNLEGELAKQRQESSHSQANMERKVTEQDIAEIVSKMTEIGRAHV